MGKKLENEWKKKRVKMGNMMKENERKTNNRKVKKKIEIKIIKNNK